MSRQRHTQRTSPDARSCLHPTASVTSLSLEKTRVRFLNDPLRISTCSNLKTDIRLTQITWTSVWRHSASSCHPLRPKQGHSAQRGSHDDYGAPGGIRTPDP